MQTTEINPKIFREYDIRGIYPEEINNADGYRLGYAFVKSKKIKKLAICKDKRSESAKLAKAIMIGASDAGAEIYDLGINSTPMLFFTVGASHLEAGIMVTPSHNPDGYTGLKFCLANGLSMGIHSGLKELQASANKIPAGLLSKKIKVKKFNIFKDYESYCRNLVDFSKIKDLKAVMDASDGAGAGIANHIFSKLKIKRTKMNFIKGDKYPAHGLNPMLAENRASLCAEVKKQKADLGIIWDGDADRCLFIDENGDSADSYHINCLLYQIMMLKYGHKKTKLPLVLDARLPVNISKMIKTMGGSPVVNRSGYTNILKTMHAKKYLFGAENSGHYFFNFLCSREHDGNYVFGDGIIPALLIMEYLSATGSTLSETLKAYRQNFIISGEINLPAEDFVKIEKKLSSLYRKYPQKNIDGLSVYGPDWFFNVRPSNTEPLIRLNIETGDIKAMKKIKDKLLSLIKSA